MDLALYWPKESEDLQVIVFPMCGLIAIFTKSPLTMLQADAALSRLFRRGPDGEGRWQADGIFLGHRRLAILDLDLRATQPMHSACGRYVIVFNGEIYNFRELRRGLEAKGEQFRTTSDTEVILALFAYEGEAMLPKLHGMFAFVIWDTVERKAFAARDPYGIKPLYVARVAGGVALASQVKALLATGMVDPSPNPTGQAGFWMLGSVPEPHTWYRDISAVRAGHCLWIDDGQIRQQRCWHDIGSVWRGAAEVSPLGLSEGQVRERVRAALVDAVDRHLVSDVPVGVFLSGGIDSGALAGLMKERGVSSLLGVTIAYDEFAGQHSDESPAAAEIARHYGIQHHVRKVSCKEFLGDLPRILGAMDQPSIDGINTWYASKAVAEMGLKVVVSGVGGDELFLGYESFAQLPRMVATWRYLSKIPGLQGIGGQLADQQARRSGNARWRHAPLWMRGMAGAWWLRRSCLAPEAAKAAMGDEWPPMLADFSPEKWIDDMSGPLAADLTLALAQIESTTYLRNQLLRDSDWASMDHSVELRTPLVDAHLLSRLQPMLSRFHLFRGKTLLATAPVMPLPETIIRRRKTGFAIPVKQWMADDLAKNGSWQAEVAGHAGV